MAHVKSKRDQKRDFWYGFNTGLMDENPKKNQVRKFKKNTSSDEEAREKFARPRFDNRYNGKK